MAQALVLFFPSPNLFGEKLGSLVDEFQTEFMSEADY
jgi:hypothetical protein